jgi:hypothetical protein
MLQKPNKETKALLDLADYFDRLSPDEYDQTKYDGCICGHCNRRSFRANDDTSGAARELGLSDHQAGQLFAMNAGQRNQFSFFGMVTVIKPSPHDAARCLRDLAVTGEIPHYWRCTTF